MLRFCVALVCLALVPGSFSISEIHKYMTPEEVQQIFHTDHDSVPHHEVTQISFVEHPRHKRSVLPVGSEMHLRAFGQQVNEWLHPRDDVLAGENTPIYFAGYNPTFPKPVNYFRRDGLMAVVGRLFENPQTMASFCIGQETDGSVRVNGFVGSRRLAVRSLPRRVVDEYKRSRRSAGEEEDSLENYHVVYELPESTMETLPLQMKSVLKERESRAITKSNVPDTIYPEVLVYVDHSIYKNYKYNIYGLLEYLLAFWNGVDLKYRSIESPKIRFHIAAIILAEEPESTPYVFKQMEDDNKAFNSLRAVYNASIYFSENQDRIPFDTYDLSITMTRMPMGAGSASGVLGRAFVGQVCGGYEHPDAPYNVGVIRDEGSFAGVHVAAHEIGHLIGSIHDDVPDKCITQYGFTMSYTPWYTTNSSDFSPCSLRSFEDHLNDGRLDCLFNGPASFGKKLPTLMPGKQADLWDQCINMGYRSPCKALEGDDDVCVNIWCWNDKNECKETGTAAIAGTNCGPDPTDRSSKKFCLHNKCVSL